MARSLGDRQATVTIHYAQTLDGRIAARDGTSHWISCEESLQFAHQLRSQHDGVMVGVGTVLADDPRLTVRLVAGRSPARVIVDSTLRLPLSASVVSDGAARTIVATTVRADRAKTAVLMEREVEIVQVKADEDGRVDLVALLGELPRLGVSSVLIEGGHSLITSALRRRIVGRLIVCVAPKILGTGVDAVGDIGTSRLGDALVFSSLKTWQCGADLIVDGTLERVAAHV